MGRMGRMSSLGVVTALLVAGCSAEADYEEGGDETLTSVGGKADGWADAYKLLLDDDTFAELHAKDEHAYIISVRKDDKIDVDMRITSGNIRPDFTVYTGDTKRKVSSTSYQASTKRLVKRYTFSKAGSYYLVARSYRQQGTVGLFHISPKCIAGPCKTGPESLQPLDFNGADECFDKVVDCTWPKLPAPDGLAGAQALYEKCVAPMTDDQGALCNEMPTLAGGMDALTALKKELVFFGGKPASCRDEFTTCYGECNGVQSEGYGAVEFDSVTSTLKYGCFEGCVVYGRGHFDCGGSYKDNSKAACLALCKSYTYVEDDSELPDLCDCN